MQLKQYAWRLTALWFWIYTIGILIGFKGRIIFFENYVLTVIANSLTSVGFAPAGQSSLSFLLTVLWLLTITSFSWFQILGFCLYVAIWPLVLIMIASKYGKLYDKVKKENLEKVRRIRKAQDRPLVTYILIALLIAWFTLFGDSSQRPPLIVAIILTGFLFTTRLNRAFVLTTLEDQPGEGFLDRLIASALKQIGKAREKVTKDLASGKVIDFSSLRGSLVACRTTYGLLRISSIWLYGRPARRRAGLIVLVFYMVNFSILGVIAILFWSLVIRYSISPSIAGMREAFLASASHVIPGIPDSTKINVRAWIQASISITAWMIFVIFAGPLSSQFPELQKRAIEKTANLYSRMRIARRSLYPFVTNLKSALDGVRELPGWEGFLTFIVVLKTHPDLNKLFHEQPEYARILRDNPDLLKMTVDCEIVLPDLQAFTHNDGSVKVCQEFEAGTSSHDDSMEVQKILPPPK